MQKKKSFAFSHFDDENKLIMYTQVGKSTTHLTLMLSVYDKTLAYIILTPVTLLSLSHSSSVGRASSS